MQLHTTARLRSVIGDFIADSIVDPVAGSAAESGWGLKWGQVPSVTNTAEALLTLKVLRKLDHPAVAARRDGISAFLNRRLAEVLQASLPRTRDVALSIVGLSVLGWPDGLASSAVRAALDKLLKQGSNRGWSDGLSGSAPALIPTYHAIIAARALGVRPELGHYRWLADLRHADGLCGFRDGSPSSSLGAASLILYLLTDEAVPVDTFESARRGIAMAIEAGLDRAFIQMKEGDDTWVSGDDDPPFRVLGYGHGLMGLHRVGSNLSMRRLSEFVEASHRVDCVDPKFSMRVGKTTVPDALELAMALDALESNFDTGLYFSPGDSSAARGSKVELDRLLQEARKWEIRNAVLDSVERLQIRTNAEEKQRLNTMVRELPSMVAALVIEGSKPPPVKTTRTFITQGSSADWHRLKDYLTQSLRLDVVELDSESRAGVPLAIHLQTLLDRCGFAVVVISAGVDPMDDVAHHQAIIHQAGLFQGRLGLRRVLILREERSSSVEGIETISPIVFERGKIEDKLDEVRKFIERETALIPT